MARADYIGCEVCDGKGLYDGDWSIRDREEIQVSVLCSECSETHILKAINKLQAKPFGNLDDSKDNCVD